MTEKNTAVTVDVTNRIWIRAAACVPDGHEVVTCGKTEAGDLLYGLFSGWNTQPLGPERLQEYIDVDVATFYAVARRKGQAPC